MWNSESLGDERTGTMGFVVMILMVGMCMCVGRRPTALRQPPLLYNTQQRH